MSCAQRVLFSLIALPFCLALAAPATQPSAEVWTDPTTPAGAYNSFVDAIAQGDINKVADFYNAPGEPNSDMNNLRAQEVILQYQVSQEARKQFPNASPMLIRGVREMNHLQPDSWRIEGDQAFPSGIPGVPFGPPMVLRDGRWGFRSANYGAGRPDIVARVTQMATARLAMEQQTLINLKAGKFKTADELADALNPYRAMQRQREQQEQQKFLTQPADPATIPGVSLAIQQAELSLNADALAKYYFVKDDPDGKYVAAAAKWFVAETDFHLKLHNMQFSGGLFFRSSSFTTDNPASRMDFYTWTEHNGIATGTMNPALFSPPPLPPVPPGLAPANQPAPAPTPTTNPSPPEPPIILRKVDNIWRVDISDQPHKRPLSAVLDDTQKLQQVTAQIKAGKFKTPDDARAACRAAIGGVP